MALDDDSRYRDHLSNVPMFGSCTAAQLDRIAELGDTTTASESDDVVREGDKGGTFFLIVEGRARVTRGDREVAMLGPGDYFGELSLFDPAPRDATVTAVGPLSLLALSRRAFMEALDEVPSFRDSLLQGMARRLRELDRPF
jgi:CRP-like cAMP-binding protein